ncbi:hypothetical protein SeMB42_g04800 [Synchytrium endobioticum]|uniref:Dymeclin n=1 Tax=Synchytrium endobioticum TaxID=286115 RepID=A0A507CVL8_9FUNG|nr:hypothetical protein SeMB42_g04800 [Synchytrium endobioticum]TPX49139.1 hypothetical protein SeLEV6574_g01638 [Synchytrium endobioticum]
MGAQESKLQLRRNVFSLYERKSIDPKDADFFNTFFEMPESAEDIFNLLAKKDIKQIRDASADNLITLLQKCCEQIQHFVDIVEPFNKETGKMTLNAIRILTRILPYVFESASPALENSLFWTPPPSPAPTTPSTDDGRSIRDTLGAKLCIAVVKCLFVRGFTLPDYVSDLHGVQYVIWAHGLGVSVAPNSSKEIDTARIETLRLLLVLLSHGMYIAPTELLSFDNRWCNVFVTGLERRAVLALLCSLLNTAMNYDPNSWSMIPYNHILFSDIQEQLVTLCLQTLTVLLDYKAMSRVSPIADLKHDSDVSSDEGYDQDDEEGIGARDDATREKARPSNDNSKPINGASQPEHSRAPSQRISSPHDISEHVSDRRSSSQQDVTMSRHNDFQYYMARMYRPQDCGFVLNGIARLVRNPLDSANVYLPGSTKRVTLHSEVLMLFWKTVEVNERYTRYTMESDKVLTLLTAMLYFILEGKQDPTQLGLIRLCCFLIHILSQDRNFAVQLNTPFDSSQAAPVLKLLPVFGAGCYGDFFLLAIHHIITTTGRGPIAALHESFMISMTNVSPYIKSLTVVTSNKLLSLFTSFANPAFLLSAEPNHKLIFYMIESLNNLIQFQVAGNSQLIYSLIRTKDRVYALAELSYESAMTELNRIRELKASKHAQAASSVAGNTTPVSATPPTEELSEKARGKLPDTASDESLPPLPATGERRQFHATTEWFEYWKKHLPLGVLMVLIDTLAPQIEQFCIERGLNDEKQVVTYLESGTLVGLLPLPQPILVRRFHYNDAIRIWFTSFLWGAVFLKSGNRDNAE